MKPDFIKLVFSLYLSGLSEVGVVKRINRRGYDKINGTLVNTSKFVIYYYPDNIRVHRQNMDMKKSYPQIIKEIFESARKKLRKINTILVKLNIYYAVD